jgi:hypothetical protein
MLTSAVVRAIRAEAGVLTAAVATRIRTAARLGNFIGIDLLVIHNASQRPGPSF